MEMHLTVLFLLLIFRFIQVINSFTLESNLTDFFYPCPDFGEIQNGNVTISVGDVFPFEQVAHIQCHVSYDLIGPPKVLCVASEWEDDIRSQCVPRCNSPPFIRNGGVQIEGDKNEHGTFRKGSLATYKCSLGYELMPPDSKYRTCEKGIWTGVDAVCVAVQLITECKRPKPIKNGYYVRENVDNIGPFGIGQRIHNSCNNGYVLLGPSTQKCTDDGNWSPKHGPLCVESAITETWLSRGTSEDTVYMDRFELTHCGRDGRPSAVFSKGCPPPPDVPHAIPFEFNSARFGNMEKQRYSVNTQISYRCYPGYELEGHDTLTCSQFCWTPAELPVCKSIAEKYSETNGSGQVLISLATGAGVLLLLIVICLVIVCRRRKPLSRTVSVPPSAPRPDLADHATLLHHPDRLALIAYADGMQVGQPMLPTYEEATRDRGPGYSATRLQRPHWPSLVARRSRNSPNPDNIHVTRQGSFASHTASSRSDPMGSTDTMAVSENSTTVTLDTASSHSGSQPASCRAHCGSLASFDTSSVLNTEGVPLLEESELEEIQGGDAVSLAMENRSMTDNGSFKLSIASDLA